MVIHRDSDDFPSLHKLLRYLDVLLTRLCIAARMIVRDDDARRILNDRTPENFPWVNEAAIQRSLRDDLK